MRLSTGIVFQQQPHATFRLPVHYGNDGRQVTKAVIRRRRVPFAYTATTPLVRQLDVRARVNDHAHHRCVMFEA